MDEYCARTYGDLVARRFEFEIRRQFIRSQLGGEGGGGGGGNDDDDDDDDVTSRGISCPTRVYRIEN